MNPNQSAVVKLIQSGQDPVVAVTEVYNITPQAALKRLFRILRHSQVYAALQASPVQTVQQPRKLMRGVYVALPGPKTAFGAAHTAYAEPKEAIGSPLNALLFEGATLSREGWVSLAADIRSTGYLNFDGSDFFILSHALCNYEVEDCRIHPERAYTQNDPRTHPEHAIPADLKDRSDLEYEEWQRRSDEGRQYWACGYTPGADGDAFRAYQAACHRSRPEVCPENWRTWAAAGRPPGPTDGRALSFPAAAR